MLHPCSLIVALALLVLPTSAQYGSKDSVDPLGLNNETAPPWISNTPTTLQLAPSRPPTKFVVSNDTLYAAGVLHAASYTGPFAVFRKSDAQVSTQWPIVSGTVYAIESDGLGGWYVGGDFAAIDGQQQRNFARFNSSGSPAGFAPLINNPVRTIVRAGNLVLIGGSFTSVNNSQRRGFAALNATTGALDGLVLPPSWGVTVGANAIAVDGDVVFIAGSVQNPNGSFTPRIGAFSITTGVPLDWNPATDQTPSAITVANNHVVAIGGFTTMAGEDRRSLAVFDRTTLALQPFSPTITGNLSCGQLVGDTLYAAGKITQVNGVPRQGGAAFDLSSGAVLPWNPRSLRELGGVADIEELEVDGQAVYLTGAFDFLGGAPRWRIGACDLLNGDSIGQVRDVTGESSNSYALALDGQSVAVGGNFSVAGGERRGGLAAWRLSDGALLPLAPQFLQHSGLVGGPIAVAVSGDRIYCGGQFASVNGLPRRLIVALDTKSGDLISSFQIAGNIHPTSHFVNCITADNQRVFASGFFNLANGALNGLGAFDATTGQPMPGFVSVGGNWLSEMVISDNGASVIACGSFGSLGNPAVNASRLARFSATTGAVATNWLPLPSGNVDDIQIAGTTLLAGGSFITIGGQDRRGVTLLDRATALPFHWPQAPQFSSAGNASATSAAQFGLATFISGNFFGINNQSRPGLAALNTRTGALLSWNPSPDVSPTQMVVGGDRLVVIGKFVRISGIRCPTVAIYQLGTRVPN